MYQLLLLLFLLNYNIRISYQINYYGDITTYGGKINGGSCGFKSLWTNKNMNFKYGLAINSQQYNNSLTCGKCINIQYNNRNINTIVTDICPECKYGDLDLFTDSYNTLIQESPGRKQATWNFIDCPNDIINDFIQLRVDEINYYWLSIQPENFKCGIISIYIYQNNNWIQMNRQDSIMMGLYFIYNKKIEIPFKFKIISEFNEEIITEEYSQIINLFKLNNQFKCNSINNNNNNYNNNNNNYNNINYNNINNNYKEIIINQNLSNNNLEFDCN